MEAKAGEAGGGGEDDRGMKEIAVFGGLVAVVDDSDVILVSGLNWSGKRKDRTIYARTRMRGSGTRRWQHVLMHQLIMPAVDGLEPDHINGNGLDNRRSNLRLATRSQNMSNAAKYRTRDGMAPTSSFKGVWRGHTCKRWCATISPKGKRINLGRFASERDAALAYNEAAKEYFGEFARLNVV